jgi:hypothetical protein
MAGSMERCEFTSNTSSCYAISSSTTRTMSCVDIILQSAEPENSVKREEKAAAFPDCDPVERGLPN